MLTDLHPRCDARNSNTSMQRFIQCAPLKKPEAGKIWRLNSTTAHYCNGTIVQQHNNTWMDWTWVGGFLNYWPNAAQMSDILFLSLLFCGFPVLHLICLFLTLVFVRSQSELQATVQYFISVQSSSMRAATVGGWKGSLHLMRRARFSSCGR